MNVLYFGSTDGTSGALHYYNSFLRLGGTVLPFDPRYWDTSSPWEKIAYRLRKAPAKSRIDAANEKLISVVKANHFDMVFVMSENFLNGETIRRIRTEVPNPPKFLYHSHDNNYSPGILKPEDFLADTLSEYDFVFTTKSQNVERYVSDGVLDAHYVPSAYEPSVHRPLTAAESRLGDQRFEAVFVGTYDKCRDAYLDAVGWDVLRVWGGLWERYPGMRAHQDRITPRAIYYLELSDVFCHSQIVLGLLRAEAGDHHTQRTFEIPAAGALQIAPRNEEILGFFEEDKEIVCFETPEELGEKVSYYLKRKGAAEKIAAAGHKRCLQGRHTYDDRVSEMLRISSGVKARVKGAKRR